MKIIVFTLLMLISSITYANDVSLKYGVGFGEISQEGVAETKYISLGWIEDLNPIVKQKFDIGAWFDSMDHFGFNRSSGFGTYSVGVRVEPAYIYAETFFGISYITQPDCQLGTNFEFTEELGIGIKDDMGKWIGIEYRHFSNAGISSVNKGRDFLLINLGIPWR